MNISKNNKITIALDTKIYPLEAVIATGYMFLDRAYIFLDSRQKEKIEVRIKSKRESGRRRLAAMKDEFLNELLHNAARLGAAKRNKRIREFIVGRALFSAVEDFDEEDGGQDDLDDPLGIAVPWDKKDS